MRSRSHRNGNQTRTVLAGLVSTAVLAASLVLSQAPARAGSQVPSMPQIDAVDTTPRVVDDAVVGEAGVRELRQVGSTMYAGGQFNSVLNAARTTTYTRRNLFSFDANTGAVTSWAPVVSGAVYTMEPTPDGRYLFVGGDFSAFNGAW